MRIQALRPLPDAHRSLLHRLRAAQILRMRVRVPVSKCRCDARRRLSRRDGASWLVQRGRTIKEVQEALGHQTITMTMRYAHLAPDHLRAAVAALDGVLPSIPFENGARMAQEISTHRAQELPTEEISAASSS